MMNTQSKFAGPGKDGRDVEIVPQKTAPAINSLKQKTISGISWVLIAQVTIQLVSFIISVILARLLVPADFGLIGMVTVFVGFATLITKMGFRQALIQKLDVEERHYSSVFWTNTAIGACMTLLMSLSAPLIARFYGEPRLLPLTIAMSFAFLLSSINIIQETKLYREFKFRRLAIMNITSAIVSGGAGLGLALAGYGVWSLVAQMLFSLAIDAILLWTSARWRPRLHFAWADIRELLGFAANLSGYTFLDYWSRNADNLLVGRFLGPGALGIYSRSYNLMLLPVTQLSMIVGQVMYPSLASVQKDHALVRRLYLKAITGIALISFPLMLGLMVVSHTFVEVLLGSKWRAVAPILSYLCLVGMIRSITIGGKWVYQSQGRTDIMLRWELIKSPVLICVFIIGVASGSLERLAQIYTAAIVIAFYVDLRLPARIIGLTVWTCLKRLSGVTVCAVVMALVVLFIDRTLAANLNVYVRLLVDIVTGFVIYLGLLSAFKIGPYTENLKLIAEQWRLRRGRLRFLRV
jgi:PST family polysaccharide transporter